MTATPDLGEAERSRVLAALRGQADELRRHGVRRLRLAGSVARGQAGPGSDVDLIAEIDRAAVARFSLLDLAGLELDLADALGREVQIVTALDELHPLVRASLEAQAIEVLDGAYQGWSNSRPKGPGLRRLGRIRGTGGGSFGRQRSNSRGSRTVIASGCIESKS